LPFADGEFDAVVSTFGVMFASKPEVAAAEISRVVKTNGRVVIASWKPDSNVFHMFGVMKKYMPLAQPSTQAAPSPFEWGRMERIKALLEAKFDLRFEDGTNHFRYASGLEAWNLWVNHYGPTKTLAESLDDEKREQFKLDMVHWHETFGSNLGYDQPRDYLITQGKRRLA
jgi:SAM-dependent methyltransferase